MVGGPNLPPSYVIRELLDSFWQITLKLGNFIDFKAFFLVSLTIEVAEIFVLMD